MNKNEWKYIGSFGVDSGQVIITDPCYLADWNANEFQDKRTYLDKKSGREYVFGRDFKRFDEIIRDGKDMNKLIEDDEVTESVQDVQHDYSYDGACNTTLYSKKMAGEIGFGSNGVVASTGYGDGEYPVYARYEDDRIAEVKIVFIAKEVSDLA